MHTVFVSVGANVGNKIKNCRAGIDLIDGLENCRVEKCSPFYINAPVGFDEQDWFVNGALKIETGFGPQRLLKELQAIQAAVGCQKKAVRFGPRRLDLDIILMGDRVIQSEDLTVPHPRMHQRRFVLQPICDIDPDCMHPVMKTDLRTLLKRLENDGQRMIAF